MLGIMCVMVGGSTGMCATMCIMGRKGTGVCDTMRITALWEGKAVVSVGVCALREAKALGCVVLCALRTEGHWDMLYYVHYSTAYPSTRGVTVWRTAEFSTVAEQRRNRNCGVSPKSRHSLSWDSIPDHSSGLIGQYAFLFEFCDWIVVLPLLITCVFHAVF